MCKVIKTGIIYQMFQNFQNNCKRLRKIKESYHYKYKRGYVHQPGPYKRLFLLDTPFNKFL